MGGGRLGEALAKMGLGDDVILRRGEAFPSDAPRGPIYVCTRNDALEAVIASVPEDRCLGDRCLFLGRNGCWMMDVGNGWTWNNLTSNFFWDLWGGPKSFPVVDSVQG